MNGAAKEWFLQRDRREQLILAIGAVCLLIFLLWSVVLQPLQKAREEQARTNVIAAEKLARVQELAAELQQRSRTAAVPRSRGSIADLVDQTLRKHGLQMQGFQPSSSGEVKLRLDGAPFNNFMHWIHELESQHSVQVRELSVVTGNVAGEVVANVRLFKG
ncbi:type II secretion system protein M [Exilibacterium tricleocarpae]|uniref:Type II secretion system protein M n=1 Tax=Exilibacterium tricleocarpae TaxID=2591008 RepID=A0A545TZ86_9GAMM|nr:type II secretion system protein M [Exilibacterium tricleocarpae]TQV82507.1 type II secretion system protein M [Exilibacterium tricleocarpae]